MGVDGMKQGSNGIGAGLHTYLRAEVGLSGLRAVELQTLPDTLPEHIQGRVGLHDLGHGLRDEGLHTSEPVAKGAVQVICQINANHHTCIQACQYRRGNRLIDLDVLNSSHRRQGTH